MGPTNIVGSTACIFLGLLSYCCAELHGHAAAGIDDSPPQYEFQYSIHDIHTGDIKDHFEHRRGDYVTGRYSLVEPDGLRRVVEYSADPILGFTAQVRREQPFLLRQISAKQISA